MTRDLNLSFFQTSKGRGILSNQTSFGGAQFDYLLCAGRCAVYLPGSGLSPAVTVLYDCGHISPDMLLPRQQVLVRFPQEARDYAASQVDKRKVGKLAMAIQVAFQELGVCPASNMAIPMDCAGD
jgi:hypothetical protein